MLRFVVRLSSFVLFVIFAGIPAAARAQTNGGVQTGPLVAYDTITASINGAPANRVYAQSIAFADWLPGVGKASAGAHIDGLCISNGSGGCDGPGTSQVGAKAPRAGDSTP